MIRWSEQTLNAGGKENLGAMSEQDVLSDSSIATALDQPASERAPSPPPDGVIVAWIQVLCGWCLFFNTYGLLNAFGIWKHLFTKHRLVDSP